MLSPARINSKPLLISSRRSVWVIIGSISILPSRYQSTIFGTSVRPRAPPKAVPIQVRPVTSWNGRVEISCPAAATRAGCERLAHHRGIAGAIEGVIGPADGIAAPFGHVDQIGHDVAVDLLGIDEVGHAEALAPGLLGIVEIDANDHIRSGQPQ